ncbi:hypothetical protein DTO169C6_8739 [Paecilomyces variotii]|nr:hypothetical protein DTO169C6_8739 [Paecilomyces variotii]
MGSCRSALAAIALVSLIGYSSSMGVLMSPTLRDLQLAANLGLDADTVLFRHKNFRTMVANSAAENVPAEYATLPIDHGDHSVGTYKNRYWVTDAYYEPGGPVIVYDGGEANAESSAQAYLSNSTQFFQQFLKEFNAIGIVWEHRYYGDSLPFDVGPDTPVENFKYLTNEQALADLPYFASNFSRAAFPDQDLTPKSTPWVMVGGSYSGMRAAFSRNQYPETFFAAFSSSAPVEARIDLSAYWDQVYRGMVGYGYETCAKDLHAALAYIDDQLDDNQTAASIKQLFLGPGAENNTNADFTAALTSIYGLFQSYGMGGGSASLSALCGYLESSSGNNTNSTFAIINTGQAVTKRLSSWPMMTPLMNSFFGTNCKGSDTSRSSSCELGQPSTNPDTISWTWQYCTQWGYFQSDNIGPHALLSRYQTNDYAQQVCYRQFPDGLSSGLLPPQPQTALVNAQTGGWTIRPSNVYFSGGQYDPWRPLSTLSTESFAPANVNFTTEVPGCGVRTSEDEVFGYIMPNAEHCFDFRTTFPAGATSRGYFINALKEWLPCFQQGA